jgi:hypothetical protein
VNNGDWSRLTDWETVCRRNAGRRHYNATRTVRRALRRREVARLLLKYGGLYGPASHGLQARIARQLGVNRSTICRDVWAILRGPGNGPG